MIRGHVRTQAYTHHAYLHPYAYAQRVRPNYLYLHAPAPMCVRPNYLYLCACSTIYLCACSIIYLCVRTTIIRARRVACVRRALIIYTCVHVTCVHYYNRFESLK
nr:MAG TPA: hypothetical protein [Caudoviricetes sp.]